MLDWLRQVQSRFQWDWHGANFTFWLGVTAIVMLVVVAGVSASGDDCRPPLPEGKHYCASLEDTGDCVSNPVNAGWKISNKASAGEKNYTAVIRCSAAT